MPGYGDRLGALTGFPLDRKDGQPLPRSSHSLNPVPFVIYDPAASGQYHLKPGLPEAGLANIAATALNLLGYEAPAFYQESLITFGRGER